MINNYTDTVAAVSTPRGKGGIATVRISGTDTFDVVNKMFKPKFHKDGLSTNVKPRQATLGIILDKDDRPLDEGILVLYKSPNSFTGEDVAEISCHGGVLVTQETLLSAIAHGATNAGPGEFTKRAFVNGKISLTEAEAVGQMIDADTKPALDLAHSALEGSITREIDKIYKTLERTMAALYAAIDYPDEDVGDEGEREIKGVVSESLAAVRKLLSTYETGRAVSEGVKTTICGRPNTGKSSLFNLVVGEEAAIVTDMAGTTRDIIHEKVSFGGITLTLSDTAGIRKESSDQIELYGVKKAEQEISRSELVLAVFDSSVPLTPEDKDLIGRLRNINAEKICVLNKTDLPASLTPADLSLLSDSFPNTVHISAKTGDARELESKIKALYNRGTLNLQTDAVIWTSRQHEILLHCEKSLALALEALLSQAPLDCICTLVEEAMSYLSESDGRSVSDSITTEVFKHFCVGK